PHLHPFPTRRSSDLIRLVLERNWKALGPKLAGKLHVYCGEEDTFYLDGPARLLKESLAKLGSDAVVELFPKKHHGNLVDGTMRRSEEHTSETPVTVR